MANTALANMAAASTLAGSEIVYGNQSGGDVKITATQIKTFVGAITSITGDATASGPGASAITFATVNSGSGSVGSSTAIPVLTTNAKGLVTAQSTAAVVAPASTLSGTTLASGVVASSLISAAGGTFGTNAFNSTAYLPLAGGTMSGTITASDAGTWGSSGIAASAITINGTASSTFNSTINGSAAVILTSGNPGNIVGHYNGGNVPAVLGVQYVYTSLPQNRGIGIFIDVSHQDTTAGHSATGEDINVSTPSSYGTTVNNLTSISPSVKHIGTGSVTSITPVTALAYLASAATATNVWVYQGSIQSNAAGTITNGAVLEVSTPNGPTTAITSVWTNLSGIEIQDQNPIASGGGANTLTNPPSAIKIQSQTAAGAFAIQQLGSGLNSFAGASTFSTSITVGAGGALTSTGAGGALGTNAFTSTAYAPLASPTFTGTVTMPDSGTWGSGGINGSIIGGTTTAAGSFTTVTGSGIVKTTLVGAAATPSLVVGNATTGFYSVSTTGFGISVNAANEADYGVTNANQWTFPNISNFNNGLSVRSSAGTMITSPSNAVIQLGKVDAASPVAQTLQVQNVATGNTNVAGATFIIQSSLSNGSGGGDFLLKTTLSSAASGTQNTGATALTLKGGTQVVNVSTNGTVSAPSLSVGSSTLTTGFYAASTTGLGASVNGSGIWDYGITTSSVFTHPTTVNHTGAFQINGNAITWPAAAISVARIDAAQTFNGTQTFQAAGATGSNSSVNVVTSTVTNGSQQINLTNDTGAAVGQLKMNNSVAAGTNLSNAVGGLYFAAAGAGGFALNATAGPFILAQGGSSKTANNAITITSPSAIAFNQYTTAGLLQNDSSGNLTSNGSANAAPAPIVLKGYTVATLPASPGTGATAYVTDALTPSFLTIIVGGGSVVTPVFFNGTNWVGG